MGRRIRVVFEWRDYYSLARILHDDHGVAQYPEANLRCAISRYYYAAFNLARKYIERYYPELAVDYTGREGSHETLIKRFGQVEGKVGADITGALLTMKNHRREADYRDNIRGDLLSKTKLTHTLYGDFVKWLDSLEQEKKASTS